VLFVCVIDGPLLAAAKVIEEQKATSAATSRRGPQRGNRAGVRRHAGKPSLRLRVMQGSPVSAAGYPAHLPDCIEKLQAECPLSIRRDDSYRSPDRSQDEEQQTTDGSQRGAEECHRVESRR